MNIFEAKFTSPIHGFQDSLGNVVEVGVDNVTNLICKETLIEIYERDSLVAVVNLNHVVGISFKEDQNESRSEEIVA